LLLVDVQRNDEVLTPALTFIATANAISYIGAIPHFVDSEDRSLGMDAGKLEAYLRETAECRNGQCWNRRTGRRIRAIVPMHVFGHPVDLDAIVALCERWHLKLIEDTAESLGSYYRGRHTGNFGIVSALSFNGNKTITTGGGGALITNDVELGKRAKHLSTTARVAHRWSFIHDEVGYNYRLPNLNAALGCAQMEQLPGFLARKRVLAERYRAAFAGMRGVRFVVEPEGSKSNYWLNAVLLDPEFAACRDDLLAATNNRGWQTRPVWTLLYKLPMYQDCPRMRCEVAESIEARLVNLPSSMSLVDADAAA